MIIFNGIKKYKSAIDSLAVAVGGGGKFCMYIDSVWARLRYGCALNHYVVGNFYKRSACERRKVFTYKNWRKVVAIANKSDSIHYLKEKVDFNTYFADFVGRDWLYSKTMNFDDFKVFCNRHKCAIIKPMSGLEGDGVILCEMPNTDEEIKTVFENCCASDVMIEEKIIQHPDMVFGNKSVNTIRVYTVRHADTGKISIIKTVVRAGIGESIVDNSHSGGCAYEIDQDLGYIISPYYAANGNSSYIHPGTEICMLGRKIPYWNEVRNICERAANLLPDCRYIGWDVAITDKGPLLIEGNHLPDLDMIEFVGSYGYKDKIMKGLGL